MNEKSVNENNENMVFVYMKINTNKNRIFS